MNLKLLKSSRPAVDLQGDGMDQVMKDADAFIDSAKFEEELTTQETIGNFEYVPAHKLTDSELDKINRKREVIKEKIEACHTQIRNLEGKIEELNKNIADYELNDKALAESQRILTEGTEAMAIPSKAFIEKTKGKKADKDGNTDAA